MAGHTKGPWRVDPASNCDVQTLGGGQEVASTHPGVLNGGYCDPTTAQANARLIAAAPELLEALVLARELFVDGNSACAEICDEAIVKATQP